MSINRWVGVGRLVKDPDLRYTPNGIAVSNFTIAINRPFKSEQGDQQADFIQCVVWRKQAENLANYQKKGNLIGVEGRIQTRNYEGEDGKRVYITEVLADSIQYLESKKDNVQNNSNNGFTGENSQGNTNAPNNQQNSPNGGNRNNNGNPFETGQFDISDDDLPF